MSGEIGPQAYGPPRLAARSLRIGPAGQPSGVVINLTLHPGELLAVVAPPGHEREELMRALAGLEAPADGSCLIDGQPAWTDSPGDPRPGILVAGHPLLSGAAIADWVAAKLSAAAQDPDQGQATVQALIVDALDLREPDRASSSDTALGRRVALAMELMRYRGLIVLEDPCAHGLPEERDDLAEALQRVRAALGTAVVYAASAEDTVTATATHLLELPPADAPHREQQQTAQTEAQPEAQQQATSPVAPLSSTDAIQMLVEILNSGHRRQAAEDAAQDVPVSAPGRGDADDPSTGNSATASELGSGPDSGPGSTAVAAVPAAAQSRPPVPPQQQPQQQPQQPVPADTLPPSCRWMAIEAHVAGTGSDLWRLWPPWADRARDLVLLIDTGGLPPRSGGLRPEKPALLARSHPLRPVAGTLEAGPGYDPEKGGRVRLHLKLPDGKIRRIQCALVDLAHTPPSVRPELVRGNRQAPPLILALWRNAHDTVALQRLVRLLQPGQGCLPLLSGPLPPACVPPFAYLSAAASSRAAAASPEVACCRSLSQGLLVTAASRQGQEAQPDAEGLLPALELLGHPQPVLELFSIRRELAADVRGQLGTRKPVVLAAARALAAGGLRQALLLLRLDRP